MALVSLQGIWNTWPLFKVAIDSTRNQGYFTDKEGEDRHLETSARYVTSCWGQESEWSSQTSKGNRLGTNNSTMLHKKHGSRYPIETWEQKGGNTCFVRVRDNYLPEEGTFRLGLNGWQRIDLPSGEKDRNQANLGRGDSVEGSNERSHPWGTVVRVPCWKAKRGRWMGETEVATGKFRGCCNGLWMTLTHQGGAKPEEKAGGRFESCLRTKTSKSHNCGQQYHVPTRPFFFLLCLQNLIFAESKCLVLWWILINHDNPTSWFLSFLFR